MTDALESTIGALMVRGWDLLAADESHGTIARHFEALGVEPTEESQRRYVPAGQRAFHHRAHCNGAPHQGRYAPEMESGDA